MICNWRHYIFSHLPVTERHVTLAPGHEDLRGGGLDTEGGVQVAQGSSGLSRVEKIF